MKNTNNDSTIINSTLILLAILFTMLSFQVKAQTYPLIYGCLDTAAYNYWAGVDVHVQSLCCYNPLGCPTGQTICEGVKGFQTTATIRVTSPPKDIFNCEELVIRHRETGSSGSWTSTSLIINSGLIVNSTTDTLNVQFWHMDDRTGTSSTPTVNHNRYRGYIRLNNLTPNTEYTVCVSYKGHDLSGTTATQTNVVTRSFTTQGTTESQTAPY